MDIPIPVLSKRPDGTSFVVLVDYNSIVEWGIDKYDLTVRTSEGWYYWIDSLEKAELVREFERTDRATLVRISSIKRYDKKLKTMHFSEEHTPFVTVSKRHRVRLNLE